MILQLRCCIILQRWCSIRPDKTNQVNPSLTIYQNTPPSQIPHPSSTSPSPPTPPPSLLPIMDPAGAGAGGLDARRLLEIAEKLLEARDLVGSKRFAERALESDPLLDGLDQTLAVADVLLASQRRAGPLPDSYSVLQLPRPPSSPPDPLALKRSYRRLSLLLHPARNPSPLAPAALRSVLEAYSVLSDPARKSLLDAEILRHLPSNGPSPAPAPDPPPRAFWTGCPACCHVFQYEASYANRLLRCGNCRGSFRAVEMAGRPPLVPGTDMYYCAWGFFPLGFRGGGFPNSGAVELPEFGDGWRPFLPVRPVWEEKPLNAVPVNCAAAGGGKKKGVNRKAVAKKRVGNYSKNKAFSVANAAVETTGTGTGSGTGTGMGISQFDIDLDATEDVLGNLHNLPFLGGEERYGG